jgi:hypothetical protein
VSYTKISHYILGAFIGALGLFNSSKLEIRQELNTNGELLFQNGQIISAALIFVCIAGIIGEFWFMSEMKKCLPNKDGMKIVKMKKKKSGKVSKKESEDKPIIKEEEFERWEDDGGPVGKEMSEKKSNPKKKKKKDMSKWLFDPVTKEEIARNKELEEE